MKSYISLILIAFAVVNCGKKSSETDRVPLIIPDSAIIAPTEKPREPSSIQMCYTGTAEKDSIFLTLEDNLGTIIGKLRYKNDEKNGTNGDIIGNQNGDTLKLSYTYQSKGVSEEREIYFLKKDDMLLEGIGEQKTDRHQTSYLDYQTIKYENGLSLKQTDCKNFDKKFSEK